MHEPPILNRSIRSTLRSSSTVSQKMTNDTFPRKKQFLQRVLHRSCSEDGSSGSNRRRRGADECRSVGGSPRLVKRGARRRSEEELVSLVKSTVPRLSSGLGKGEGGRVAVFGGCVMYSGAAYIAAIAALRCGADMVHVFCEKEAGHVLRTFGPELVTYFLLITYLGKGSNTTLRILSVKGGRGVPPKSVTPFLPKVLSVKGGGEGYPPCP